MRINALTVCALELARGTRNVGLFTIHFVRVIATVIFAVASVLIPDALEVLARKLAGGAGLVPRVALLSLVGSIATIVVVVAQPALESHNYNYWKLTIKTKTN